MKLRKSVEPACRLWVFNTENVPCEFSASKFGKLEMKKGPEALGQNDQPNFLSYTRPVLSIASYLSRKKPRFDNVNIASKAIKNVACIFQILVTLKSRSGIFRIIVIISRQTGFT